MNICTLDAGFLKKDLIENFESIIWTERYYDLGDVTLVAPATPELVAKLPEGTFLAIDDSQEVMRIDTVSIENNVLTVTGPEILSILNDRVMASAHADTDRTFPFPVDASWVLGQVIDNAIYQLCIGADAISGSYALYIGGNKNNIPNLTTVRTYDGPTVTAMGLVGIGLNYPFGPFLDTLFLLAKQYAFGLRMILASASGVGYSLELHIYEGLDRTSTQMVNPLVRFSPALDSLANTKELRSIAKYKNIAYAFPPTYPNFATAFTVGSAGAEAGSDATRGFDRHVLLVLVDDIDDATVSSDPALLQIVLNQRAKDALANNNYIKVIDGEVVLTSEFIYGRDYGLGDIVELQAPSGALQQARVTEYIRSADATGERAYPTVTVI